MSSTGHGPPIERMETEAVNDLVGGWLGGLVGIIVSNPFEVLKVRLQTAKVPSSRVGGGSRPGQNIGATTTHQHPGFISLYRAEGSKFLFAGAAGPIIGLAFIDSAFFATYGASMNLFQQNRENPQDLSKVFASGAISGGICALLQTPIEVVKCRAQAEKVGSDGRKMGSFQIARTIANEGVRGFYVGGLATAFRDGISSGIFFWAYMVGRHMLRGDPPFDRPEQSTAPPVYQNGVINTAEIGRMFLAGGVAGSLSATIPYPLDIIKTRMQTANIESKAVHSTGPPVTFRQTARGILKDGISSFRYRYHDTFIYSVLNTWVFPGGGSKVLVDGREVGNPRAERWALRILGLKGFAAGLKPTVVSSFVGSAFTITTFELALVALNKVHPSKDDATI